MSAPDMHYDQEKETIENEAMLNELFQLLIIIVLLFDGDSRKLFDMAKATQLSLTSVSLTLSSQFFLFAYLHV
jgi:hypothetical protein